MHARTVDRPPKDLLEGDQPVTIVEEQTAEDLVRSVPQLRHQKTTRRVRCIERRANTKRLPEVPTCEFHRGHQYRVARWTYSRLAPPARAICAQQLAQRPEFRD